MRGGRILRGAGIGLAGFLILSPECRLERPAGKDAAIGGKVAEHDTFAVGGA